MIAENLTTLKKLIHLGDEKFVTLVCEDEYVIKALTNFLKSEDEEQYMSCLEAIAEISSSDNPSNIDKLIENGILNSLASIMTNTHKADTIRTCLLTLSNITAGSDIHIEAFLKNMGIIT